MNYLLSRQAWIVVICLIALDIFMLTAIINRPVYTVNGDQSTWDFRIAELRRLETEDGVYDVSLAKSSAAPHIQPAMRWVYQYFPGRSQTEISLRPVTQPVNIHLSGQPKAVETGSIIQLDRLGQVL